MKVAPLLIQSLQSCCHSCVCPVLSLQVVPDSAPIPKAPEQVRGSSVVPIHAAPKAIPPHILQGAIPSGHIPKPVIVPDYIG